MKSKSDCGNHGNPVFGRGRRAGRSLCSCLLCLIVVALIVILIVYLVLRPHKPRFYVQDATVRQWNISDGVLTSALQFTVLSRNPNDRIGIYYDRISAYTSYLGQQITPYYPLPPFYQGHKDVNVLSPIVAGDAVTLAPFVADHLRYEQQSGVVTLHLRILGKIRWKVGTWTSGHYHLSVDCYTLLGFSNSNGGTVPLQPGTRCDVDV